MKQNVLIRGHRLKTGKLTVTNLKNKEIYLLAGA